MKNILSEVKPELLEEWSEKNSKKPDEYSAGSSQEVWWKCSLWQLFLIKKT